MRAVRKSFGPVEAVKGLDLDIQPGDSVAFLGPNGAGKTTTIDMAFGLSKPASGNVVVFAMDPRTVISNALVAAVMQTGGPLKDLTVGETALFMSSLIPRLLRSGRPDLQEAEDAGSPVDYHVALRLGRFAGVRRLRTSWGISCRPRTSCRTFRSP